MAALEGGPDLGVLVEVHVGGVVADPLEVVALLLEGGEPFGEVLEPGCGFLEGGGAVRIGGVVRDGDVVLRLLPGGFLVAAAAHVLDLPGELVDFGFDVGLPRVDGVDDAPVEAFAVVAHAVAGGGGDAEQGVDRGADLVERGLDPVGYGAVGFHEAAVEQPGFAGIALAAERPGVVKGRVLGDARGGASCRGLLEEGAGFRNFRGCRVPGGGFLEGPDEVFAVGGKVALAVGGAGGGDVFHRGEEVLAAGGEPGERVDRGREAPVRGGRVAVVAARFGELGRSGGDSPVVDVGRVGGREVKVGFVLDGQALEGVEGLVEGAVEGVPGDLFERRNALVAMRGRAGGGPDRGGQALFEGGAVRGRGEAVGERGAGGADPRGRRALTRRRCVAGSLDGESLDVVRETLALHVGRVVGEALEGVEDIGSARSDRDEGVEGGGDALVFRREFLGRRHERGDDPAEIVDVLAEVECAGMVALEGVHEVLVEIVPLDGLRLVPVGGGLPGRVGEFAGVVSAGVLGEVLVRGIVKRVVDELVEMAGLFVGQADGGSGHAHAPSCRRGRAAARAGV